MAFPDFPFSRETAEYYLQKWHGKGWYTYSETLGNGELTQEGLKHAGSVGIVTQTDE